VADERLEARHNEEAVRVLAPAIASPEAAPSPDSLAAPQRAKDPR
jgi:hypothetical protein